MHRLSTAGSQSHTGGYPVRSLTRTLSNRRSRRASLMLTAAACAALVTLAARPDGAFAARLAILPRDCRATVTVRSGDTLGRIAAAHGTSAAALARLNSIDNPDRIWPGERICIRTGSGAAHTAAPPVTHRQPAPAHAAKGPNQYPWGSCTWLAEDRATRDLNGLGNAKDWAAHARARGLSVSSRARVGATVVFAPGVQGASSLGHVA